VDAGVARLEQLRPADACFFEVRSEALGRSVKLIGCALENQRGWKETNTAHALPMNAPRPKSGDDAGVEDPGPRIVGLVLVEAERTAAKVEVAPLEPEQLADPHPLAGEDAKRDSGDERDRATGHQRRLLVRVEVRFRLLRPLGRHEALRDRARGDHPHRVGGQLHDARDDLRVMPSLRLRHRGQGLHHLLRVLEREVGEGHVSDERVDPLLEQTRILVSALLPPHVVGEAPMQLAARPPLTEVLERHAARRPNTELPGAESIDGLDHLRRVLGLRRGCENPGG